MTDGLPAQRVPVAALVATGAVLALAGCGKSDREKVRDVVEEFATDLREKWGEPCDLLSGTLVRELGGRKCDSRLRHFYAAKVGDGGVTVHRVYKDSSSTRAEATVGDVQLSLNDGLDKWHIDTLNA